MQSKYTYILSVIAQTGSYTLRIHEATVRELQAIRELWADGSIQREPDYTESNTVTYTLANR